MRIVLFSLFVLGALLVERRAHRNLLALAAFDARLKALAWGTSLLACTVTGAAAFALYSRHQAIPRSDGTVAVWLGILLAFHFSVHNWVICFATAGFASPAA